MNSRPTAPGRPGKEETFFFRNEGDQLFGILHSPSSNENGSGLIFCDPFGEEKEFVQRTFVTFARRLCREGFHVLRFDYRGCGDSTGESEDVSLSRQVSDVAGAIDLMSARSGIREVGLLGLRLGGTSALLAAERDPRIRYLVLWAPTLRPASQLDQALRRTLLSGMLDGGRRRSREQLIASLETEGRIELDGYFLGREGYAELAETDLTAMPWDYRGDVLAIDIAGGSAPDPDLRRFFDRRPAAAQTDVMVLEEQPFWSALRFDAQLFPQGLCDATTDWLTRREQESMDGATRSVRQ